MLAHTAFSMVLAASPHPPPPPFTVVDEYVTRDGHRTRWASVTYTLPDGQSAEVVLVADDAGGGDGYIFVDGEALVHASYDDANNIKNTWTSSAPGADLLAAAVVASLAGEPGNELLDAFAGDSRAFKCSAWGKKVLRASKYMWAGLVTGAAAVCCIDSAGVACPLCAAGPGALGAMGADHLGNYCD